MYCQHYNGTCLATWNGHCWNFLLILPPYYCPAILSICNIHNKISFWGNSKMIDFWPYTLVLEATGPKILWSKDLNFLVPKDVYICQHQPPKCRSWSVEIFLFQSTLILHGIKARFQNWNQTIPCGCALPHMSNNDLVDGCMYVEWATAPISPEESAPNIYCPCWAFVFL